MSTTADPPIPNKPPLEAQTTVGNYFVSNYPPFSFWKKDSVPENEAAMEEHLGDDSGGSLSNVFENMPEDQGVSMEVQDLRGLGQN